jgi:hypothetical protein
MCLLRQKGLLKPCLKTAAARDQKNAGRGRDGFFISSQNHNGENISINFNTVSNARCLCGFVIYHLSIVDTLSDLATCLSHASSQGDETNKCLCLRVQS